MHIADFDYDLPEDRIAQEPVARREDARLLVLDRTEGTLAHRRIRDLPGSLRAGDLVVVNDTRVLPARLHARRASGGRVEILLLERAADMPGAWTALVRAGGTPRAGEILEVTEDAGVRLLSSRGGGQWLVQGVETDLRPLIERRGLMPLPPYIRRDAADPRAALDRERYQTLFAKHEGAVAAPTAGLHLTPELFQELALRGVSLAHLTLHVGLGTFEPVRTENLEDHRMHEEYYAIGEDTVDAVRRTRESGGRIVAVGTTSVRALEASAARTPGGLPQAGEARTDLLLAPGSTFRVVDALLTNFHLPRSTLMALVSAFAGRERVLDAYRVAVREGYRFYSYGDAMLIL